MTEEKPKRPKCLHALLVIKIANQFHRNCYQLDFGAERIPFVSPSTPLATQRHTEE